MMLLQQLKLMKESFPATWVRKLPLLLLPIDTIIKNGELAGMCCTFKKRIILLCISSQFRRQGIATELIKRSRAIKTDTYLYNKPALNMYLKSGFKVEKIEDSLFGKRYLLVRELD